MRNIGALRSELFSLEASLKRKSIKLNPRVLEDSSSDSD